MISNQFISFVSFSVAQSEKDYSEIQVNFETAKVAPFKFASLAHTEVFATKSIISAITIRFY